MVTLEIMSEFKVLLWNKLLLNHMLTSFSNVDMLITTLKFEKKVIGKIETMTLPVEIFVFNVTQED